MSTTIEGNAWEQEEIERLKKELTHSQDEHRVTAGWGRGAVAELARLKKELAEAKATIEKRRLEYNIVIGERDGYQRLWHEALEEVERLRKAEAK